MSARKKISDYMPEEREAKVLVQAKINKKIHTKTMAKLKAKGKSWSDLVEGSARLFLEEK